MGGFPTRVHSVAWNFMAQGTNETYRTRGLPQLGNMHLLAEKEARR